MPSALTCSRPTAMQARIFRATFWPCWMTCMAVCYNGLMEYKEVPGFPAYRINDKGRLQTRWTWGPHYSGYTFPDKWKDLPSKPNDKGYIPVNIRAGNGKSRRTHIHRLVAEVFIGPPPFERAVVRHLDGNPLNNSSDNLSWGSYKDNEDDKIAHGTHNSRISNAKLTPDHVREIRSRASEGEAQKDLATLFGVSRPTITRIVNRTIWEDA